MDFALNLLGFGIGGVVSLIGGYFFFEGEEAAYMVGCGVLIQFFIPWTLPWSYDQTIAISIIIPFIGLLGRFTVDYKKKTSLHG